MADGIVSLVVEKLWDLVSREHELLEGVEEQVSDLKSDLNMLMSFLKDVDAKKQTSALARNCVEEIKEITYDAEDLIETFLLKEEGKKCSGIKNGLRSLACIPGGRKEIALEITSISKRISKVIHVMQNFGIQSIIIDGGYSQAMQERKRVTRHTFSTKCENNLVGLEKNVEKLVRELVRNNSRQLVCITGLGGIGKTTLAQHVFNHDKVKHYFDGLAWVCVSQEFKRMDVWETILRNLSHGDKASDTSNMKEGELQKNLFQWLETKKALIVFDDIWKKEDWDTIKQMFPEKKGAGWKVLLTSRNDGIDPRCIPFKPKLLSHEESWTLLQKIAFPDNNIPGHITDGEMVKLAKKMAGSCGGLPLAVKVLGGLLAMQYTLREWRMIHRNVRSHIVGGINIDDYDSTSIYHVLSLSFEGLPVYLKHCLLYLASFPEDYKIELEKLSYYWAAEGVLKPWQYGGANIRDVADVYIEELVKRNLVISERDLTTSRFETCHLHDTMREICLLKAKEENFFQIVNAPTCSSTLHSQGSKKSRRLVVHRSDTFQGKREIMNPKLRSLLFIKEIEWNKAGLSFTRLQLLRILDLSKAKFKGNKLPSSIGELIHLRYLSLYEVGIKYLPSFLGNLKLLLYLDLRVSDPVHVSNVLNKMQELKYLCLPRWTLGKTKLELGNLVNLETLKNFSTKDSSVWDLKGMTKLNTLSIYSYSGCTLVNLSSLLSELKHLENLSLYGYRKIVVNKVVVEEEFDLDCIHLKILNKLELSIYMPRLPDEHHFPSHLTTITLSMCRLVEDPMPILEKLLHLKEISLLSGSYRGREMVCTEGGFPQLMKLEICGLDNLEEWTVEEGSMPILHTLVIISHGKLNFPDGIIFLTKLKELEIKKLNNVTKESLCEGGDDYYKVKHIPSVRVL